MSLIPLCRLDELAEKDTRGFELSLDGEIKKLFVVRKNDLVYAYQNCCPHVGAPLEWLPDQFLDYDRMFIQCALHGALFAIESGLCLRGPCIGASLQALPVVIKAGMVFLSQ